MVQVLLQEHHLELSVDDLHDVFGMIHQHLLELHVHLPE
jgi:hypothetical protein